MRSPAPPARTSGRGAAVTAVWTGGAAQIPAERSAAASVGNRRAKAIRESPLIDVPLCAYCAILAVAVRDRTVLTILLTIRLRCQCSLQVGANRQEHYCLPAERPAAMAR